jgi:protein tyrosine phosphatase
MKMATQSVTAIGQRTAAKYMEYLRYTGVIYEFAINNNVQVHLVSEHIWCEDYVVRSFYLKNLRTAETRTVTQFHYVNWPDHGVPSTTKTLMEFRRFVISLPLHVVPIPLLLCHCSKRVPLLLLYMCDRTCLFKAAKVY